MQVYILRHAKADFGSKDPDPPVSAEGRKQTEGVLDLASESLGFKPTVVVTSPILRARQTGDLVKKRLHLASSVVVDGCLNPDAKPAEVLAFLSHQKKDDGVVLISHMPLIFNLLYSLIGGEVEVELLNGSIAAVEFKGKPAAGKGKLTWLVQPKVSKA
jgi:phosphohistidine phosphatase